MQLTLLEKSELDEYEAIIEHGLRTFVDVGRALLSIRDSKLYRDGYDTWENYCKDRWGMQRAHAYRMIEASTAVRNLSPMGDIPTSERQARPLTQLPPVEQPAAWERAQEIAGDNGRMTAAVVQQAVDEKKYRLAAANHAVSTDPNYDGDEWYTPIEYIESVRRVLGDIDLDPATCEEAQAVINAKDYLTKGDDSLEHRWWGRVFLNPPYSARIVDVFVDKLIAEYSCGNVDAAIILTNNSSDTAWFHKLATQYPLCLTRGRVRSGEALPASLPARDRRSFILVAMRSYSLMSSRNTEYVYMSNLRNPSGHASSFWDWSILNGCFGDTIRVSDIDGIVERKGHFLIIETKQEHETMPDGQLYTLKAFVKQGHSVVVVTGNPQDQTILDIELWRWGNGAVETQKRGSGIDDFRSLCEAWYEYANRKRYNG